MTREEFISELAFIFNMPEDDLVQELELSGIKAWDSIGMLSVITLMREIGSKVRVDELRESKTVGDLLKLVEAGLS